MIYGSLFSGIEAASVAWRQLGWECAWVCETDRFASAVLAHHYPEVPNLGDVTKVDWDAARPVDLVVGGAPCQDFSVAGLRKGLDGARGNLSVEFFRIVGRLRPRWVVFENVPGLLSMDEGRAFGHLLGLLAECGYGFAYRILDAQHSGVPQRRRRVFVVGYPGDWRPPAAVLFDQESLLGHPAPRREKGKAVARPIAPGSPDGSGYRGDADTASNLVAFSGNNTAGPIDVATAPSAHGGPHGRLDFGSETFVTHSLDSHSAGQATEDGTGRGVPLAAMTLGAVRRLTPREAERLMGLPDDYTAVPYRSKPAADGPRYRALGNSMAIPDMRWIGERIAAVDLILARPPSRPASWPPSPAAPAADLLGELEIWPRRCGPGS